MYIYLSAAESPEISNFFFVVCVKYRMFRQAKYKQFVSPRLSSPSTIDFQKC